jgi:8-oxo-dGTP pyrophosphatase MutT (NUDIX family)
MELWKQDGIQPSDDWSSLVFVRVLPDLSGNEDWDRQYGHIPVGYVFVIEEKVKWEGYVAQWKFPGGHKEPGEDPLFTARRELLGETYISPDDVEFHYVKSEWMSRARKPHWKIYFTGDVRFSKTKVMCEYHPGNEGERPHYFTLEEFWKMVNMKKILPQHYQVLLDHSLILPMERDKIAG